MAKVNLGRDSSGRPLVITKRCQRMLAEVTRDLGFQLTIVQGSWSGAKASAGTHIEAGVLDARTWDLPAHISPQDAVRSLRRHGFIAWYRHRGQGFDPHIHAIDLGCKNLAASAARQVLAWRQGRNGLASNGPDDGRPREVHVWKRRKSKKKAKPEPRRKQIRALRRDTKRVEGDAKGKRTKKNLRHVTRDLWRAINGKKL